MPNDFRKERAGFSHQQGRGIRYLAESALRSIASSHSPAHPETRAEWVERFCEALMSQSETSHHAVITELVAKGVSSQEIYQAYVPEAARQLGQMWLKDEASFVDVTVGAARLQKLFRHSGDEGCGKWMDRSIPLGQSILMAVPDFEEHSLGAFVAADQFRRHGIWVNMAIGMTAEEIAEVVREGRFAMVGVTLAVRKSIEPLADMVKDLRAKVAECPPIVVGGKAVEIADDIEDKTGVDHAVKSVREAVERCGLASVAETLSVDASL
ncbi:cobalamin B12-binding domain-containing protein [Rhodovulum sp. YNF3179]|uniref:cobalamin B12-binding domain-containing protein n=1 Tax=Rhodovulum sp. YNF3179 TaxID=3425127 RepID=UPI003D32484C